MSLNVEDVRDKIYMEIDVSWLLCQDGDQKSSRT